jgi:hypothetical protein
MRATVMMALVVALPCGQAAWGDNWPNWRGPALDGTAGGTGYVAEWSPDKHVLWKVSLPGLGASTPAVWGDRVVVTCTIDGQDAVIGLDRGGTEVWRRTLGKARDGKHKKATGANSSPVTDGERVWV